MVGKLNDMVTAAVVVDSTPKASDVQSKPVADIKSQTPATLTKPQDVQAAKEEEKKQQEEGRLQPGTMSEESVLNMTETFNKLMDKINCNIQFSYNREADVLNVKMIDKETNEVIKEFPPEERIENMIKAKDWLGAFIDKAV